MIIMTNTRRNLRPVIAAGTLLLIFAAAATSADPGLNAQVGGSSDVTVPVGDRLYDITRPGDPILTVNGVNDGDLNEGPPPAAETVDHAIDDFGQKYLNFLDLNSGFSVTPSGTGRGLPVTALTFYTANDSEPRDPASYRFSGSNGDLINGPWTLISAGDLALPSARNVGGNFLAIPPIGNVTAARQQVTFDNNVAYTHYQVIFPTLKDSEAANSMSIGEVELQTSFTLIEFEGVADPGAVTFLGAYSESGYDFSTNYSGQSFIVSGSYAGSGLTSPTGDYGFTQNDANIIELKGSEPFRLVSVDMAMLFGSSSGNVEVVGHRGGGTVTITLNVPAVGSHGGSLANFIFDESWTGLTSVTFTRTSGNFLGIDNIAVTFSELTLGIIPAIDLLLDD